MRKSRPSRARIPICSPSVIRTALQLEIRCVRSLTVSEALKYQHHTYMIYSPNVECPNLHLPSPSSSRTTWPMSYLVSTVLLCLTSYLLTSLLYRWTDQICLPPGPTGLPIIGTALHLRGEKLWLAFAEWAKVYGMCSPKLTIDPMSHDLLLGDVMHFSVFGHPIVVLNSRAAVVDLLERRSALYSDRPRSIFAGEM